MSKKRKVPKHIAGVKVPKPVRRRLTSLACSQAGRTALNDAFAAAAAVLAAHDQPRDATAANPNENEPQKSNAKARSASQEPRSWAPSAEAFEQAAKAFANRLREQESGSLIDPIQTASP